MTEVKFFKDEFVVLYDGIYRSRADMTELEKAHTEQGQKESYTIDLRLNGRTVWWVFF